MNSRLAILQSLARRFIAALLAGASAAAGVSAATAAAAVGGGVAAAGMGACIAPGAGAGSSGGAGSLLGALLGNAASPASCLPAEPASQGAEGPSTIAGNPVDVLTGAKLERVLDLALTPRDPASPPDLVFSRNYASARRGLGALGPGWSHGYETRLHRGPDDDGDDGPQVLQADGRVVRFDAAATRVRGALRHAARLRTDGVLDRVEVAGEARWRWSWPSGRTLHFREDGRLVRIDEDGRERVALHYDARGRLASLVDSSARRLSLVYARRSSPVPAGGADRLAAVVGPGATRVEYDYDDRARLAAARYPDGRVVRYRYADDGARLASVERDDGAASAYRYDPSGRVIYSRAAGASEADALAFSYSDDPGGEGGVVVVSAGGRERAEYRWRLLEGARRLTRARGEGCPSCPGTDASYEYRVGQIVRVERGGARFDVERDARGRVVRVVRQAATLSGLAPSAEADVLLRVGWRDGDDVADRPVRIARPGVVPRTEHVVRFHYDARGRFVGTREDGFAPVLSRAPDGPRVVGARPVSRSLRATGWPPQAQHGGPLALPAAAHPVAPGLHEVADGAGRRTRYWSDDFGRVVAVDSPETGLSTWTRDSAGRIVREEAADGVVARYRHDASGRLVEREVGTAAHTVATRYVHATPGLVAVEHPNQDERYAYDAAGRLAERTVVLKAHGGRPLRFRTEYRYDPGSGRLAGTTLPDGSRLSYERGARGQVVALRRTSPGGSAATLIDAVERSGAGIVRARFGNGVEMFVERGAAGRPRHVCHRRVDAAPRACDVLDHRLEFGADGRLRRWTRDGEASGFEFDARGALSFVRARRGAAEAVTGYAYDASGRRLDAVARSYDRVGRVLSDGRRRYRWNPDGTLAEVFDAFGWRLRHEYNHRGERVAKRSSGGLTLFLYDESRRPLAEVDPEGRVQRIYVHLADLPIAVVDAPGTGDERITYLHLNHLGAPEAATDVHGRDRWRGVHAPFGRLVASTTTAASVDPREAPAFAQPLRLPGQYEDVESGLHYNDHRFYDPDAGLYLSPDPLGLRAGLDPYGYAANDPLSNVDPTGLLLFAFDGTGNGDPPPRRDDWSNVYKLARSYADGRVWYMAGVGLTDLASGIAGDALDLVVASTARARVDHLLGQLDGAASDPSARGRWLDVDVIGFSRGAAMARDFVNRVSDRIVDDRYRRLGACVRLRFLGLWDTVAQFGLDGTGNLAWRLAVPSSVAWTAHAVALNEHRMLFPGESILGSPLGGVRIERGFVGAHADVGGSYAEGDLSDVALNWMHRQAGLAGVRLFALSSEFARVTAPLLHDSRGLVSGDREFRFRTASGWTTSNPMQRVAPVDGMRWRDTAAFIERFAQRQPDAYGDPTLAGTVNLAAYAPWLASNYSLVLGVGP